MVWNEKRQRFDWREVRRYSYRRDEYDPILVKVTGLYSVYCGQGWEPGSRQSRDSSRLSDDPTSWSGTTRLRWSRPGARFKRQAWSDIWCRPRLCRGPGGGAKGSGHSWRVCSINRGADPGRSRVSELKSSGKPFEISKAEVWQAWEKVKANKGAPGVDGCSVEDFEADLKNNLYKVWNRMSSGSYFPPPVRAVEIPKPHGGGTRILGVPTVADRVAQTVVARRLEARVEPTFHPDSYGYRPGRAPQDAVEVCRRRCWRTDWVIDLDIQQVLRQRPQGPGHQGGGGEHRFAVGSPVREAVAGCAGAEPRRHRADARPGYPTRVSLGGRPPRSFSGLGRGSGGGRGAGPVGRPSPAPRRGPARARPGPGRTRTRTCPGPRSPRRPAVRRCGDGRACPAARTRTGSPGGAHPAPRAGTRASGRCRRCPRPAGRGGRSRPARGPSGCGPPRSSPRRRSAPPP